MIEKRIITAMPSGTGIGTEDLRSLEPVLTQRRKGAKRGAISPLRLSFRLCVRTGSRLLKSSVPIPVPLGIAVIILFSIIGLSTFRQSTSQPQNPIVIHVPVEVPVIQEKTVTQVVYRDRRRTSKPSKRARIAPTSESTFARSLPTTLNGFKPTDEVKLTVIKGGIPNEK